MTIESLNKKKPSQVMRARRSVFELCQTFVQRKEMGGSSRENDCNCYISSSQEQRVVPITLFLLLLVSYILGEEKVTVVFCIFFRNNISSSGGQIQYDGR